MPKVGLHLHPVAAPPAFVRARAREVRRPAGSALRANGPASVRDAREAQGVTRIGHGARAIGKPEAALRETTLVAARAAFCDESRRAGPFERITA